jgi:hypothetical protein
MTICPGLIAASWPCRVDRRKLQSFGSQEKSITLDQRNSDWNRNRLRSENKWTAHGDLTLHGQSHPVKVDVERQDGRYRGSARLRQSEFGITPVTVAGGTIKVKDEVRVEFEIVGR